MHISCDVDLMTRHKSFLCALPCLYDWEFFYQVYMRPENKAKSSKCREYSFSCSCSLPPIQNFKHEFMEEEEEEEKEGGGGRRRRKKRGEENGRNKDSSKIWSLKWLCRVPIRTKGKRVPRVIRFRLTAKNISYEFHNVKTMSCWSECGDWGVESNARAGVNFYRIKRLIRYTLVRIVGEESRKWKIEIPWFSMSVCHETWVSRLNRRLVNWSVVWIRWRIKPKSLKWQRGRNQSGLVEHKFVKCRSLSTYEAHKWQNG